MKNGQASFWYSPTYRIIKAMQATGNQAGLVRQWIAQVAQYAEQYPGPDADALLAWLPHFQMRPFYTAAELAPLFPALAFAMQLTDKVLAPKSPARMAHELEYGKVPKLRNEQDGTLFRNPVTGGNDEYFIVERQHMWSTLRVSHAEFELFFPVRETT